MKHLVCLKPETHLDTKTLLLKGLYLVGFVHVALKVCVFAS